MKYKNPFQNKNDLLIVPWKAALDSKEQKIRRAQSFTPAKEERAFYSQIPSCPAPTEGNCLPSSCVVTNKDKVKLVGEEPRLFPAYNWA